MKKAVLRFSFIVLSIFLFNSCFNNDDVSITEPERYTSENVKSYSDLFEIFWKTMDQRYNYFYEQKRNDGMDWKEIYEKYSPKFKALKTFGRTTENDQEIYEDYIKAKQYFDEIVDPIIDKHFSMTVFLPVTNNNRLEEVRFYGGKLTGQEDDVLLFQYKYWYMKDRVIAESFIEDQFAIGGYLTSNPDIYYFTFSNFSLTQRFSIILKNKYLSPDAGSGLILTTNKIENSAELNSIQNIEVRNRVKNFTLDILNEWNGFIKSDEISRFNTEVNKFNTTEVISAEFIDVTNNAINKSEGLVNYSNFSTYFPVLDDPEAFPYINWFIREMNNHVNVAQIGL